MAIIINGVTRCAICHQAMEKPYMATSGVAFPKGHPLQAYCDAMLHIDCLATWPHRIEFSRGYFNSARKPFYPNSSHVLIEKDDWILLTGPTRSQIPPDISPEYAKRLRQALEADLRIDPGADVPRVAAVVTGNWPLRLHSDWSQWDAFINGGFERGLSGEALTEARRVIQEVRRYVPNFQALKSL